jgi:crotonobetainyl-CoA:carnitine CoA-transferase CaiB-like acyl-CoA transferase
MLLEGLKVVEMATWVAAPGACGVMADWGADVIKVESPAGDATRAFSTDGVGGVSPVFAMENRGKRSVVLDVTKADGRSALLALLRDADVFVTNVRPTSMRRLRLDHESLKEELPRLIYATVTGYGLQGPEADRPAFDITAFWTGTGVARATIPPDQEPFACRPGFGDHTTALATLSGILAALHERASTGKGRLVETSLVRAGAYAIGWDLAIQLRYGRVETTKSRNDAPNPLGYFHTADDRWVYITSQSTGVFPELMSALGLPEIANDERYALPIADIEVVREVRARIDERFARITLVEATEILAPLDIIWAVMGTLEELTESEAAELAGCFETVSDGKGGTFRAPAAPVRFPEGAPAIGRAAPGLGEHNREVLEAAGLGPEEIDALSGSAR